MKPSFIPLVSCLLALTACGGSNNNSQPAKITTEQELTSLLTTASPTGDINFFQLPDSDDYANIPQDPSNPLSAEKVAIGQVLFHDTVFSTNATDNLRNGSYSCASCHHAGAGFKAGIPQGIGDGGSGFGILGENRVMGVGMDALAIDGDPTKPDIQPLATPTALNTAYQDVMLWNGQFGNSAGGINALIDPTKLSTVGTPKEVNTRGLSGLETQAIAGLGVHRMNVETDSALQLMPAYQELLESAFATGTDDLLKAGLAIAAYERTLLANQSPFQLWLRGDTTALDAQSKEGAIVFFGKGNCVACHTGPALSSPVGASDNDMFFALGFDDFDQSNPRIHSTANDAESRGRGGFTGNDEDDYKFKVPQLYNLIDSPFYGHGASFESVRTVLEYKNTAIASKLEAANSGNLASAFTPLGLTEQEIADLAHFLETGLYDANLERYVPQDVPSGECFPVADSQAVADLDC